MQQNSLSVSAEHFYDTHCERFIIDRAADGRGLELIKCESVVCATKQISMSIQVFCSIKLSSCTIDRQ